MEINKKADGIFSTDLLSNEVICIHTDGSVDVVVSNDNDEVGNVEHDVETTVQNDESPKVFSFEECKAAAEQCEDVGEFILKFTDEYDYAYKNDWLKDLFENIQENINHSMFDLLVYEIVSDSVKEVFIFFNHKDNERIHKFYNYCLENNINDKRLICKLLMKNLTKNNKSKYFRKIMEQYESDGCNILYKPFYAILDKNDIISKAKRCKNLKEFRTKYFREYIKMTAEELHKDCPWLYKDFYTIEELKHIVSKYKNRAELKKCNSRIYKYLKRNNLLDELIPTEIKNREYWLEHKNEIIEISRQYKTIKDFKENHSSEYYAAKRCGFYNELQIQSESKSRGYWQNYDNIRNEALKYDLYRDFSRECHDGCEYARRIGWIDDFDWLKKRYTVDLNKHEHWVYAYVDEENKYVYIGLTREKTRHKQHNTRKNNKGEYTSTAKRYFESVNKPLPKPIILKNDLNAEEAQYYEDYFVKKYKSEGWNIINISATGINSGSLGFNTNFKKWNNETVTELAKTCKTGAELASKSNRAYEYARDNGLLETFDWMESRQKQRFYKNWTEEQFVEYFNQFNNRTECYADKTSKAMLNFAYNRFELKGVKWYHRRKSFDANRIEKQKAYSRQYYLKKKENRDKPKEDNNE